MKTPALAALARAGADYRVISYDHSEHMDHGYALDTASVLGVDASAVFKTLVVLVDGKPVMGLVPATSQLALKALAKAAGGKRAGMCDPAKAEKLTGYVTGGISPLGSKTAMPIFIDESALSLPHMYVSGGQRTLTVEIEPKVLADVSGAGFAPIAAV